MLNLLVLAEKLRQLVELREIVQRSEGLHYLVLAQLASIRVFLVPRLVNLCLGPLRNSRAVFVLPRAELVDDLDTGEYTLDVRSQLC